jgi:hypothetical protein
MTKLQYTFKTDTLFKMLFVKHQDLLERLVAQLLGISLGSIEAFKVTNPEMPPESLEDKFCRMDINMTVDGVLVMWLSLFKAETEEELEQIKRMEVMEMTEAIKAYQSIVVSPEFREVERLRAKARHDEAQAIWNVERKAEERTNAKWEGVVADKDTLIAELRRRLGED